MAAVDATNDSAAVLADPPDLLVNDDDLDEVGNA